MTRLPLTELWDDAGPVSAAETRELAAEDIRDLLRDGPVRFVVAAVGQPLRWMPVAERFQFWKGEAQERVAKGSVHLEDFPGG